MKLSGSQLILLFLFFLDFISKSAKLLTAMLMMMVQEEVGKTYIYPTSGFRESKGSYQYQPENS